MAKEWYLMTRPLFNSGFEKEEFENFAQDGFSELLESFISSDILIYETNDFNKFKTTKAIIQNVTTDSDYNTFIRQISVPINTIYPVSIKQIAEFGYPKYNKGIKILCISKI